MRVGCGVLEQGLLEAAGPIVYLSGDLPQHKGMREEEGHKLPLLNGKCGLGNSTGLSIGLSRKA